MPVNNASTGVMYTKINMMISMINPMAIVIRRPMRLPKKPAGMADSTKKSGRTDSNVAPSPTSKPRRFLAYNVKKVSTAE